MNSNDLERMDVPMGVTVQHVSAEHQKTGAIHEKVCLMLVAVDATGKDHKPVAASLMALDEAEALHQMLGDAIADCTKAIQKKLSGPEGRIAPPIDRDGNSKRSRERAKKRREGKT